MLNIWLNNYQKLLTFDDKIEDLIDCTQIQSWQNVFLKKNLVWASCNQIEKICLKQLSI